MVFSVEMRRVLVFGLILSACTNLEPDDTTAGGDGRMTILLSTPERDELLEDMRALMQTTQAVIQAVAARDMAAVARAASEAGVAATAREGAGLFGKLPSDFIALGIRTHRSFDEIARVARREGDPYLVMEKLGEAMDGCIGCHAGYRLGVTDAGPTN